MTDEPINASVTPEPFRKTLNGKSLSPLCRRCDYAAVTRFLGENATDGGEGGFEAGRQHARERLRVPVASPEKSPYFWHCRACKLLQIEGAVAALEKEAGEPDEWEFRLGVESVVITAKKTASNRRGES